MREIRKREKIRENKDVFEGSRIKKNCHRLLRLKSKVRGWEREESE